MVSQSSIMYKVFYIRPGHVVITFVLDMDVHGLSVDMMQCRQEITCPTTVLFHRR